MFEQFDADVRDEIHQFLEIARDVLHQAYRLLRHRQEGSDKTMETRSASKSRTMPILTKGYNDSTLSPASSEMSLRRPSSFHKLWWSVRDKKRIQQILQDFMDLNGRIHENIKLWCLGTSIGVNMQHLNRLQENAYSRALGFDVDAGLQIAVSQTHVPPYSLKVDDPELCAMIDMAESIRNGSFSILTNRKPAILIERRSYAPQASIPFEMDNRTHELVNQLAGLLHQRKGAVFRTPPCQGWIKSAHENTVAFVFHVPDSVEPSPTSMLEILQSTDMGSPSLGSRFWLAVKLARFISQLQLVKWVRALSVQLDTEAVSIPVNNTRSARSTRVFAARISCSSHRKRPRALQSVCCLVPDLTFPSHGSSASSFPGQKHTSRTDTAIRVPDEMSIVIQTANKIQAKYSPRSMTFTPWASFCWRLVSIPSLMFTSCVEGLI